MKVHLTKVSLALLSTALVLGCQDVGTGPDGLVPQFARGGKGKPPSGDVLATVTLVGGMTTKGTGLELVGKNDVQTVTLAANPLRNVGIVMSFGFEGTCIKIFGEGGKSDGDLSELEKIYLLEQLTMGLAAENDGGFFLEIDKTDLPEAGTSSQAQKHHIIFGYDDEFDGDPDDDVDGDPVHVQIKHQHSRSSATTVTWNSSTSLQDVYTFTGPIRVGRGGVGGLKGRRGGRAIFCGEGEGMNNLVTVTVSKPGV